MPAGGRRGWDDVAVNLLTSHRYLLALTGAVVVLAACTPASPAGTTPSVSPTGDEVAGPPAPSAGTASDDVASDDGGPVDAFRTWLAASRAPDVDTACGGMTPELAQRLVDKITAQGIPGITDCPTYITATASLFQASGQSSSPQVEVVSRTDAEAVLDVVYTEGAVCGRVVLTPVDGVWLLSERETTDC